MGALIDPRIPEPVRPLLDAALAHFDHCLPGLLAGFYLHGSITLDAFHPRFSDVDFIAVVSHPVAAGELSALREIHRDVARQFPRPPLEGSYLGWPDLGLSSPDLVPHPDYHDGKLSPTGHLMVNRVTWWLLKAHGIALRGPDPDQLPFQVDWSDLIAEMKINLNTYWATWADKPRNRVWLLADSAVQWAVLGVLRQFYSFREGDIVSKTAAGRYALGCLPGEWHRIIREAIRCREGGCPPLYRSRLARAAEVVRFLRAIVPICDAETWRA